LIDDFPLSLTEMIKRALDVISLVSVVVIVGVGIWMATWGEGPRALGHVSIQSKIIAWDLVPLTFGVNWLIIRYAKAAVERFPRVFGRRGILFYVALALGCVVLLEQLFPILSKLLRG
jgi:hypothetical protein